MKKIILASTSPRRKELLSKLGVPFEIVPSDFEEDMTQKMSPSELVQTLALGKAENVAQKYTDALVLGADTIIAFNNKVLGKPKGVEDAIRTLSELSGKQHSVFTGFVLIDTTTGKRISKALETKVFFRELTQKEIENYVQSGEPLGAAGSYMMQSGGSSFVEGIEGDYFSLVGLPIVSVREALKAFGVDIP